MKSTIVIYHANCPDGFGGAWAAWRKFKNKATYLPQFHDEPLSKEVDGKIVYLVDFAYRGSALQELLRRAAKIVLIDHHKTNEPIAAMVHEAYFDLAHSGAVLSWKYFHPKEKIPLLLRYIEDNDIWKHELPKTREIGAALRMLKFDFLLWNRFAKNFESRVFRRKLVEQGILLREYRRELIEEMITTSREVRWNGSTYHAVNSSVFVSELGRELAKRWPPLGIVWYEDVGRVKVSLRVEGEDFDAAKLAEKYGGGGHRKAAGFTVPTLRDLPWKDSLKS